MEKKINLYLLRTFLAVHPRRHGVQEGPEGEAVAPGDGASGCCRNPTSGSFTINPHLQRHFATFAISFPCQDLLYTSIATAGLGCLLESPSHPFSRSTLGPEATSLDSLSMGGAENPKKSLSLYLMTFHVSLISRPNEESAALIPHMAPFPLSCWCWSCHLPPFSALELLFRVFTGLA
jgi:hypothetical protein